MTEQAAAAVRNAITMEVKKDGLAQRQDGSWIFRVRVHPNDMDEAISKAPMGTRYQVVLVELNDNDEPKERRQWNELPPASQAGIRCAELGFRRFLGVETEDAAANEVRRRCEVQSRSELSTNERASAAWEMLDSEYQRSGYR